MPFAALMLLALAAGAAVLLAALRYPHSTVAAAGSATGEAGLVRSARRHGWLARLLRGRLDPEVATGLALTLALSVAVGGGIVLGVLAYLMRTSGRLAAVDRGVGAWGADHASHGSTQLLQLVTDLAWTPVAIGALVVVAVVETMRVPSRFVAPFLVTVLAGEVVIVNSVKMLLDRVRPTFNPIAETLGPSFPSGHSATAAALYAACALVLGRRRPHGVRALLAAAAVALAVAVAASRVLLGVHWLSDAVAGIAFGWAWFAVCAIAFGGRLLRFGAPVARAAQRVEAEAVGSDVVEVALQRPEHTPMPARDPR